MKRRVDRFNIVAAVAYCINQPIPACHVTEQIGKEWQEYDKSFSSYDVSWHPMTQTSGVPHPVNIRFGMGIEFFGKEVRP
jgi:hypothetical protein